MPATPWVLDEVHANLEVYQGPFPVVNVYDHAALATAFTPRQIEDALDALNRAGALIINSSQVILETGTAERLRTASTIGPYALMVGAYEQQRAS